MKPYHRKTTPKVKQGKVQHRNNILRTPSYWNTCQTVPVVDKERPGQDYRHYLRKQDILEFISLLPDWQDLAVGLDGIVLARGEPESYGWYVYSSDGGVIGICAWPRTEWIELEDAFYKTDAEFFDRLGVPCELRGKRWVCKFSPSTIKAYQLLNIFIHELGHHHDRMTTRSKQHAARGEGYAEKYVTQYGELIWSRYTRHFGL